MSIPEDPFPWCIAREDAWAIGTILFVWLCYAVVVGGLVSAGHAGGF
jgi:hypothetical protein